MDRDFSRHFLVTKLACSVCGNTLALSHKKPGYVKCEPGEPTGADKLEMAVSVHPCETCLQPVKDIKRALKLLQDIV